jgi:hypothetical protein
MEDIRYYDVFNEISESINKMNKDELNGALDVVCPLFSEFYRRYFTDKEEINVKALVKTLEELFETAAERRLHLNSQGSGQDE